MQTAVEVFLNAGLIHDLDQFDNIATVISGHNLNQGYTFSNHELFNEDPDFIEGLFALKGLDTNYVGIISEVLQLKGAGYTVGGACASGNMALRCAVNEVRFNEMPVAAVIAPVLDYSPLDIQGMAVMGAISYQNFNERPTEASRARLRARLSKIPQKISEASHWKS